MVKQEVNRDGIIGMLAECAVDKARLVSERAWPLVLSSRGMPSSSASSVCLPPITVFGERMNILSHTKSQVNAVVIR